MLPKSYIREVWNKAVMPFLDFFTIVGFALFTYKLRYDWQISLFSDSEIFSKNRVTTYNDFFSVSIIFAVFCVIYFAFSGLYQIHKRISVAKEFFSIALGVLIVMGWLVVFLFFNEYAQNFIVYNTVRLSRFLTSFGTIIIILGLYSQRLILRLATLLFKFSGLFDIQTLFIGNHPESIIQSLKKAPNFNVLKVYNKFEEDDYLDVQTLIESHNIEVIYINYDTPYFKDIIHLCERYKIQTFIFEANLKDMDNISYRPKYLKDQLYLELRYSGLEGWGIVSKRIFDVFFSLAFITVFGWLYILIGILIYAEDKGNPVYLSKRVGPDGKEFDVYKFRRLKMKYCTTDDNKAALEFEKELIATNDIRNDGVLYKITEDPRATKVGELLEKTSLDEIPQFFNVLIGNLSVVGPRPHQPREVEKYQVHHFKVLNIKPGITGLAQINGRSDLSFEQEVVFDSDYVKNWSFWLDLKIIIATPLRLIRGHKN
jgi:lipopolysaccharide/colanic/teichoic acid biosynthesis glycosyltransferase